MIVLENNPSGRKALTARKWFADNGPSDLQPLPLGYNERERLKHGGADHILAWYARSLEACDYDVRQHPSFDDYARGVMASDEAADIVGNDATLQKRFPPRELAGMGPGFCWLTPKDWAETMPAYRRSVASQAEAGVNKCHETDSLSPVHENIIIPEVVRRAAARALMSLPAIRSQPRTPRTKSNVVVC